MILLLSSIREAASVLALFTRKQSKVITVMSIMLLRMKDVVLDILAIVQA